MAFKVITDVTTEPVTVAEAQAHCRIDAAALEPAPGAITCALASPAVAGNVDNGAHRYLATFVTADGETHAGVISAAVTVADKTVNGKVSLTAIPTGGALVTSRKLYRTAAGGSAYLLLATISDNTTTIYTDNIADSALGAEAPSVNTTADPEILSIITAAREFAEHYTGRALAPQTLEMALDRFPGSYGVWPASPGGLSTGLYIREDWHIRREDLRGERDAIELDMPAVATITSIKYTDTNGAEQTLATSVYSFSQYGDSRKITPTAGNDWPATQDIPDAVRIRYVTGYTSCPKAVKQGILLQIQLEYPGNSFTPVEREAMEKARDSLLNTKKLWGR